MDEGGIIEIDCAQRSVHDVNTDIKRWLDSGQKRFRLTRPLGMHNIGVGITDAAEFLVDGDVGYYAFAESDHIRAEIHGNAGWGVAENLMGGEVIVDGNVGNAAAPSLRNGTVVIRGNAGARAGIGMKGGTLLIQGDVGYMSGFMMQKGTLVVLGSAGDGLGDSLYEGARIFIAGTIAKLGNDAKEETLAESDAEYLRDLFRQYDVPAVDLSRFRKVENAGYLRNFDKREFHRWKHAL